MQEAFNFRQINPQLTTSGFVTADLVSELKDRGYGAVINLLPDHNDRALHGEGNLVLAQGLRYVHIPVDFDNPTDADLEAFFAAMDECADVKTHAHCAANWRVSAFVGLYLVSRGTWTVAEADELIAGLWTPDRFPAWAAFISAHRAG